MSIPDTPHQVPLLSTELPCQGSTFVVNTGFDFEHDNNKKISGRYTKDNTRVRYRYTQRQRKSAENATGTNSLDEIKSKVRIAI